MPPDRWVEGRPSGQTYSSSFWSAHPLMSALSKKPSSTGISNHINVSLWHKMMTLPAYSLDFSSWSCLCCPLILSISDFPNGDRQWRGRVSTNTKVSASPPAPRQTVSKKKKNNMLTLLSLIPMKITCWQGGCHGCLPHPLTHRQLQVIHARCHAAVVCGNCKLLLKSPGEWL